MASPAPAAGPSKAHPAITEALHPSTSTKRLSTVAKGNSNGSPGSKNKVPPPLPNVTTTAVKDVVSPGELCGFVSGLHGDALC